MASAQPIKNIYVYPIERMEPRSRAGVDSSFDHGTWVEAGF